MMPGQVILLENVRFHPEEEKNDPVFAQQLSVLADIYVNDAFGSAHRAHASTEGVAHLLPAVAGFLMEKEIEYLGQAIENPQHPYIAILGGAKISDKIGVIENLLTKADRILIGGGMANTFLKRPGLAVGDSLVEDRQPGHGAGAAGQGRRQVGAAGGPGAGRQVRSRRRPDCTGMCRMALPAGWRILDIGPRTVAAFGDALKGAALIVWNGPMGVFEFPAFAAGTNAVAGWWPAAAPPASSAAATRWRPSNRPAWPTRLATSPPAAGPAWRCWKARFCRAWPRCKTNST